MVPEQTSSSEPSVFLSAIESNKGGILIIALWSLCLLATFAVYLGAGVRQKITLVKRLDERDKLHFIGEAGIKRAIVELRKEKEEEKTYDALSDAWNNNASAFKQIRVGDGRFNIYHNYIDAKTGLTESRYGLIDEERKININKADRVVLERLFKIVLGFDELDAQELAASIVDWRDGDSYLSIPLGSAEDPYYRSLQYSYEAKDAEFEVLDEVLLVKHMTRQIFDILKDYITIYGDGKVNSNTASKEVLLALGLNGHIVDEILAFRCGEDGIISTSDDNVFEAPSDIVPKLSQHSHLSDSDVALLSTVRDGHLITNSNYFMARSEAGFDNRKDTAVITAVINRDGKILYWQES